MLAVKQRWLRLGSHVRARFASDKKACHILHFEPALTNVFAGTGPEFFKHQFPPLRRLKVKNHSRTNQASFYDTLHSLYPVGRPFHCEILCAATFKSYLRKPPTGFGQIGQIEHWGTRRNIDVHVGSSLIDSQYHPEEVTTGVWREPDSKEEAPSWLKHAASLSKHGVRPLKMQGTEAAYDGVEAFIFKLRPLTIRFDKIDGRKAPTCRMDHFGRKVDGRYFSTFVRKKLSEVPSAGRHLEHFGVFDRVYTFQNGVKRLTGRRQYQRVIVCRVAIPALQLCLGECRHAVILKCIRAYTISACGSSLVKT